MKIDRRKAAVILAAIVLALVLGFGVKALLFGKDGPKPVTATVAVGNVEQTVMATGSLEPVKLVSVGAQVTGQIQKLHVVLGQTVAKGQLIAEIDSAPQENALQTAQADLANIRAQRAQLDANLAQSQLAYTRQQTMLSADATSRADFEAAEAALKAARSQVAANAAQIQKAAVAVETAKLNLSYTRIVAPIDGTVVAIVTEEGQTVSAQQSAPTIIKLGQLDTMTVKAEVSEADVIKVHAGQSAYFTVLGDANRRYTGTLRTVEPAPETIETEDSVTNVSASSSAIYYNALFDVPNTDGRLRTFMTAQVSIVLGRASNVLTIPSAALGSAGADGAYAVQVMDDHGGIAPRKVRIGLNDGSHAEVKSGLKAGEQVVLAQTAAKTSGPNGGAPGGMRRGMGGLGGL
ncbi:efflux RND transporter periplasmic adaptor subunit [Phenylobacterium sp.]|uniref:efflux RND transporter periplasmic adaptor subunit n=1 Tax=Phenylobacterium sp. TaxID=1871053 RepID=UPI0025F80059|nr:efflux RND transporter periplasmic adaptor subunit [Phenylobacterium sp.]MBX3484718.1 efflux RND transporter periplasmic adaptor subunit [Phenylobacterium sp.]MCW5758866.1 efflux RND transporter periplasmic adaptor subunit [Phenylobacterium sp.]